MVETLSGLAIQMLNVFLTLKSKNITVITHNSKNTTVETLSGLNIQIVNTFFNTKVEKHYGHNTQF